MKHKYYRNEYIMKSKHLGSCLCETVKYEITGDFESFYLCHCKYCQKDTGSAHAANLFSTTAQISWTAGQEKVKNFNLQATRHCKSFCMECGSALPHLQMDGQLLVTPAGSLNTKVNIKPTAHLFCASQASWENDMAEAKKFQTYPQM